MLDSLLIKNFRSLEHLEVRKLGRVNLIVGKNNSGKSTVLEALRIYAGNAQRPLLEAIAREHNERYKVEEQVSLDDDTMLPFQDFFTGRSFSIDGTKAIEVGEIGNPSSLLVIKYALLEQIEVEVDDEEEGAVSRIRRRLLTPAESIDSEAELQPVFSVKKGDRNRPLVKLTGSIVTSRMMFDSLHAKPCSVIPTDFISMDELADEWDAIVLTDQEEIVKRALRIISPDFESLVFVRDDGATDYARSRRMRTAMVKLKGMARPVPLNSLGDGMLRVLQLSLKLFGAKGGFFLIDEFENGLHYSIQEKVWELLFEMAERYKIQIFATTHSWDCIESFTKVAVSRTETDGVLFRLGRSVRTSDHGKIIATVFDEEALKNITQTDMEVR